MSPYDLERLCDDLPGIPAKPTRVIVLEADPLNHPVAPAKPQNRGYRLTETQVRAMRQDRQRGCKFDVLGEVYGVSPRYARDVCSRREYRYVA